MELNAWVLHDTFTVNGVTVCNEAFPYAALEAGHRYSDNIKLTGSFGSIVLPAVVTDCNFDPRYNVYVERTAVLDNVTGSVTAFGLTGDGEIEATHAACDPIAVSGHTVVTARLYLAWQGTEVLPTYPDNVLLRWLLGCADRPAFSIGLGHDRRPFDRAVRRDASELTVTPATVTFADGRIDIIGTFETSVWDEECVLLADGVPVVRARAGQLNIMARYYPSRTVRGRYVELPSYDVCGLGNVVYNSKNVSAQLLKRYESMSEIERQPLKVGHGTLFGSGVYCGIIGNSDITLLKAEQGQVRVERNFAARNALADVTSDGTLVVYDGELTVYTSDGPRHVLLNETPDRIVAIGTKSMLGLGVVCGTTLYRYRITADTVTRLETIEDVTFVGRSGTRLVYGNATKAYAKTASSTVDSVTAGFAQTALAACDGTAIDGDGFLLSGDTAYDLETGMSKSGFTACFGEVLIGAGKIWIRDYTAAGFIAVGTLPQGTTAVYKVGSCLIGLDADGLWLSQLSVGKSAVYSTSFNGGKANVYTLVGMNINENDGPCSYAIRLTLNPTA